MKRHCVWIFFGIILLYISLNGCSIRHHGIIRRNSYKCLSTADIKDFNESSIAILTDNSLEEKKIYSMVSPDKNIVIGDANTLHNVQMLSQDFSKLLKNIFKNEFEHSGEIRILTRTEIADVIKYSGEKARLDHIKRKFNHDLIMACRLLEMEFVYFVHNPTLFVYKKYLVFSVNFFYELIDVKTHSVISSGKVKFKDFITESASKEEHETILDNNDFSDKAMREIVSKFAENFKPKLFKARKSVKYYYPVLKNMQQRNFEEIYRRQCERKSHLSIKTTKHPESIDRQRIKK